MEVEEWGSLRKEKGRNDAGETEEMEGNGITNKKLHIGFRLVPKSVTLNDLERRNGLILRYFAELGSFQGPT